MYYGLPKATADQEEPLGVLRRPESFALHQNYPNPFNPSTLVQFDLPEAGNVSLIVYDLLGREVAALVDGYVPAGYHRVTWNTVNGSLSTGLYFVRLSVTDAEDRLKYTKVTKLMLIK